MVTSERLKELADIVQRSRAKYDGVPVTVAEELLAEVERLRAGGCARDQGLTQFCAEAAKMSADLVLETRCALAWKEEAQKYLKERDELKWRLEGLEK